MATRRTWSRDRVDMSALPADGQSRFIESTTWDSLTSPVSEPLSPEYAQPASFVPGSARLVNIPRKPIPFAGEPVPRDTSESPERGARHVIGSVWEPGFFSRFPWSGILAMLGTIICTIAVSIVLVISDNKPINHWHSLIQPTVYISIFTALANILLTFALYKGMVISFWRKIVRGATWEEVHQYWHSGTSFHGALKGMIRQKGRVTAIACLFTIISILRGPFFQRASDVRNVDRSISQDSLTFHSAQQLPQAYTGMDSGRTSSPSYMNPNFTSVVQQFYQNKDIQGMVSGCQNQTCYTNIRGFGFGVSCNSSSIPYDLEPVFFPNGTTEDLPTIEAFTTSASTTLIYGHGPATGELDQDNNPLTGSEYDGMNTALLLNATFMSSASQNWTGNLTQQLCALRGGTVSYPVKISNGTITLQSDLYTNDTFLEDQGLLPLVYAGGSNVAGFVLAANNLYASSASYEFGGGVGYILNLGQGLAANTYLHAPSNYSSNAYDLDESIYWDNPMDDMINGMRQIAFRTALRIAGDNVTYPNAAQSVLYTGTAPQTVYTTNYRWLAAATVVSLLGVMAVIPTYRGFWELGRLVSMSPLELAKAFDAPLLRDVEGNIPAEDMLKEMGSEKIRYGDHGGFIAELADTSVASAAKVGKLHIGIVNEVKPPVKGARYI